ncbi:hypothetical protein P7K49_023212 [Saguinus oedipus]|uniref:Uncharacterized protein n=1 Tax=Saguinus oedipus TaxID=9490 RepID=A0ABQ9ULP2_SAGOE|nr:hypothetical protein P7K49_023212 [Saguinus oedipus]
MRAEEIKDAIYVTMEILSNWGNSWWVGLTEVEFFDLNDTKLYVSPHDVDIRNTATPGELGRLVNRNLAVSRGALDCLPGEERKGGFREHPGMLAAKGVVFLGVGDEQEDVSVPGLVDLSSRLSAGNSLRRGRLWTSLTKKAHLDATSTNKPQQGRKKEFTIA